MSYICDTHICDTQFCDIKQNIMEIKNPFLFGKIVTDENFCNRQQEISKLKTYINDCFSVWLFAPRRYGKSSLIQKVFNETKNVKTIYFDLYNIQSLDDFCRKYSSLLAKELFDWKQDVKSLTGKFAQYFKNLYPKVSFDEFGTPSFSLDQKNIENQPDIETILDIPNQIAKNNKIQICIAFDEFQEIERLDKFLINWMRTSFQNQKNVSYIFLGSKQSLMSSIFTSLNSPFYEFAVKMEIKPIETSELEQFIRQKFQTCNMEISDKNISEILLKSECHPHFTQYFSSVVFDFIRNGENQNDENFIEKWIQSILNSQSMIFQNIYDQLNNNQRRLLIAISTSANNSEIFSKEMREKYNLPTSSSLNTVLKSLLNKDLIKKDENLYKIINPVFKEWLNRI